MSILEAIALGTIGVLIFLILMKISIVYFNKQMLLSDLRLMKILIRDVEGEEGVPSKYTLYYYENEIRRIKPFVHKMSKEQIDNMYTLLRKLEKKSIAKIGNPKMYCGIY